jgi:DNA polymerase-1
MEFDASGQEFRWMAIASEDQTMLELCLPGEDAHGFMGARITNVDYRELQARLLLLDAIAKDARQLGKVANLSLQYRTSARKLRSVARVQYGLPMEQPQADYIRSVYLKTYTGVPKYWDKQIILTRQQGYVETYAGRRVQVVGDWAGRMGWSMASTAINYRIQGTGADQKYLALMCLKNELRQNDCYFAWDLHDGIYIYSPTAKRDTVRFRFKAILDHLPYKRAWGFEPPIELPFDCKMGGSWGHMAEMKDMG